MVYTYVQYPDPNYRAGVQGSSSGTRATVSWHMDAIYRNAGTARYDLQFVEVKIGTGDWMRVAGKVDGSYSFTAPYNSTQRVCVRGYYKRNIAEAGPARYGTPNESYLPEMCTTIRMPSPPPPPPPVAPACPAATSLNVTVSGTTATLTWASAAQAFEILRDGVVINTVGGASGTAWSYVDPGRTQGQSYTYTVRPFVIHEGERFYCPSDSDTVTVPRTTPPPAQPPAPSCPAVTGITIRDSGTSLVIDWTGSAPNFEIWRDGSKLTDVGPGRGGIVFGSTWKYQVFPIEFAPPGYYETFDFLDEAWASGRMPYGHVHPGVRTLTGNTCQDTAVWARRKIPAGADSYTITVKVDDEARVFWNGYQIGFIGSTNRDPGVTITVPQYALAGQRGGEHLLAIRQADTRTELVGPKFSASYLDVQVEPSWSSYTDPNRTPGQFYCYRVRPYVIHNGGRYYCPEMGICGRVPSPNVPPEPPPPPPPPPEPPSITCYAPVDAPLLAGSLTEVELAKWTASLDWAGPADGYRLFRQEQGGTAEQLLDRRTGFMQHDDPGRTPCKTYSYWVVPYTVCSDGSIRTGPKSNTVTLAVPCDVPPGTPDPAPELTATERGRSPAPSTSAGPTATRPPPTSSSATGRSGRPSARPCSAPPTPAWPRVPPSPTGSGPCRPTSTAPPTGRGPTSPTSR